MERDPVCGISVDPEKAKAKVDHGEKSYYFCSAGCAKKFEQTPQQFLSKATPVAGSHGSEIAVAAKPAVGSLPILGSAPMVPMVKDPVCGMMVDPQTAAGKAEYAGKSYFFCSPRCKERFEKEPEKFLAAPGTAGMEHAREARPPASAQNIRYTCPMHPEIVQFGPGNCPICGMALEPMDIVAGEQADPEYDSMRKRLWVSAALSLPLLVFSMAGDALGLQLAAGGVNNGIELLLASPVVLWGGWPFFERFWASLVNRSPNMFTLIGLGTGAAFLESVAATIFPQWFPKSFQEMNGAVPVYFEAAAVITTLVLLGQVMELSARQKTAGAIRELLHLAPQVAHQLDDTGREKDVSLTAVQRGDLLRV